MGKSKPAPLGASLITKGSARPAVESAVVPKPAPDTGPSLLTTSVRTPVSEVENNAERTVVPQGAAADPVSAPRAKSVDVIAQIAGPTKSMTVKIDEVTYRRLKMHGVDTGRSSQDIFVEALAQYFKTKRL